MSRRRTEEAEYQEQNATIVNNRKHEKTRKSTNNKKLEIYATTCLQSCFVWGLGALFYHMVANKETL